MKKKSFVRGLYLKNMISLVVLLALMLILYGYHLATTGTYVRNYASKGYGLDTAAFFDAVGQREITPQDKSGKEQGLITGYQGYPAMFYKDYVYWEGKNYRFTITPEAVTETGIYYDNDLTPYFGVSSGDEFYEQLGGIYAKIVPLERLVLLTVDGNTVAAIAPYYAEVTAGQPMTVVLTQLCEYTALDLGRLLDMEGGESYQLCRYFADLRGVPVEFEDEDYNYTIFYSIVLGLILALNIIFFVRPQWHPTYYQLKRYGSDPMAVAAQIDAEYSAGVGVTEMHKEIIMPSWLVSRSGFKNVITRNHNAPPENAEKRTRSRTRKRPTNPAQM